MPGDGGEQHVEIFRAHGSTDPAVGLDAVLVTLQAVDERDRRGAVARPLRVADGEGGRRPSISAAMPSSSTDRKVA